MAPTNFTEHQYLVYRFQVIQDALLHLSTVVQQTRPMTSAQDVYAHGLVLKASLQFLTIRNIYEAGEWHSAIADEKYNYLIDPVSVGMVLRGAFECMLTLHHIFVEPPSPEEFEVRYLLWELATHNSQIQAEPTGQKEVMQAREEIRACINERVNQLLELPIVKSLDEESKKIIRGKAQPKAGLGWEYYIEGSSLTKVKDGWHGLSKRVKSRGNTWLNLYKLFSLTSHPTLYSVDMVLFDFEQTDGKIPENLSYTDDMLEFSAVVGAFMLYDYCTLFEEALAAFNRLSPHFKTTINLVLKAFKGEEYEIA